MQVLIKLKSWYALFGLNANKLIMIIVSLATAMSVTAIPLLSGAHARRDYEAFLAKLKIHWNLFLFVMIPASLGWLLLQHQFIRFFMAMIH
jgi:O-antigen/teichoic acid export membrane protein